MAILQLYGYGTFALTRFSMVLAFLISAFILYLMLSVNPWISHQRQQVMASDEATVHLVETLIPGRFQVSPDGKRVVYVEALSNDRTRAQNVFLAQAKPNKTITIDQVNNQPWMIVFAKQGFQTKDKITHDPLFVTRDGYRYEGTPGQNDFKIIQYEKYATRLPQADTHLAHQDVEALSLSELWREYHQPKRAAELQWRFSVAITVLILGLLAVPLSYVGPRQGRYRALFPAILIYIIYIQLLFVAKRWVEQAIVPSTLGVWWVHAFMLLLAMIFFIWQRRSKMS
jgi:lipopolysaccharide export system permease protein